MNSISFFKALLMKELEEKDLPGNQEKIAQAAEPKDKITAADFAALRAKKGIKENETPKHKIIAQLLGPDFFLSKKPESQWDEKDHDLFNRIYKMATETGKVPKMKTEEELKLGVKYDLDGETGFISTGGSEDPSNWKFLGDKGKYAYLSVKDRLVPSKEQPGKYDGAFNDNPGGYILPEKEGKDNRNFEVDDIVKVKATGKKGKVVDMSPSETFFIVNIEGKKSSFHGSDLELIKRPSLNETEDHEVSMAHNSIESIIKSAMELKMKLGDNEKDIPAWIQDHITNAENYINQASKNYHEYSNGEHDMDELPDGTEELPAGDEEDAEMSLKDLMESIKGKKKKNK